MKKRTASIISIFFLLALASCSSEMYQASWQTKKVVVDGNPSEWSLPLRYSDPESGLQYNITNDETNIYFCLRATERPAQMKILTSGMVIWLDPSGKNKETIGIHFPLPVRHERRTIQEEAKTDMAPGEKPEKMSLEKEFELQKPEIALSGFLPEYNGTFGATDAKGAKAAIKWDDQDNMTYELAIPFQSFYTKDINTLKDNPIIGFMIKIAAFTRPQGSVSHGGGMHGGGGSGQHHGNGGGGIRGMEGGRSGGMGESHQPAGENAYRSMSEATSIKFKIKLNGLVKK